MLITRRRVGRTIRLVLGATALLAVSLAPTPEPAAGLEEYACYERYYTSNDEHKLTGTGTWLANGPHGWLYNLCADVHNVL